MVARLALLKEAQNSTQGTGRTLAAMPGNNMAVEVVEETCQCMW